VRRLTLQYIKKLVTAAPKLMPDRRPRPMPGRKWPTHVAWHFEAYRNVKLNGTWVTRDVRSLSYIGKPSRYRAQEARNFQRLCQEQGLHNITMWQAEFDRAGLVAYGFSQNGSAPVFQASGAFAAYHPHSPQAEVVGAFVKALHLKYVGGMRLYSQKAKIKMEDLDAYYEWYHKQFRRRLRRPKPMPSAIIGGQPLESLGTMEEPPTTEPVAAVVAPTAVPVVQAVMEPIP
jgi:hypothetical protein